jgi:hypothetical protein
MTNLIPYAEALAKKPPVDVYKQLMKLFSEAQIKTLDPSDAYYKQTKEEYEAIASKWDSMVANYGEDIASFSVMAICDFVAMCMMITAAGSARVEALKAALHGRQRTTIVDTSYGDRACLLLKQDTQAVWEKFRSLLSDWCKLDKNGIVQFKFPAENDLHTFVIERAPESEVNDTREFIVYQGYQNTYSLELFLGIEESDDRGDDVQERFHKKLWERREVEDRYKNGTYARYDAAVVSLQRTRIHNVALQIGNKQKLNLVELNQKVIAPLAKMLRVGATNDEYVKLTGSPTTSDPIRSDYMIMLMCDQVAPGNFGTNCKELEQAIENLTTYVEYSPP